MQKLSFTLLAVLVAVLALAAPAGAIGQAPKVTVGLPANGSWAKTVPSFTFSVTGTAVQKTCVLSGPDTYIDEDPCSSPWRPVDVLPDGTYTYTVLAENADGTDSGSTSFQLDSTTPTLSFTSAVTEGYLGNAQSVAAGGVYADANIDTVTCRLDNNAATPCGNAGKFLAQYSGFGEGAHKIVIVATDKAGNSNSIQRNFSIDRTAPSASILLVGGGSETKDNTPAFLVSGADTNGPVTKRCRIENQIDWVACSADSWVVTDGVADGEITAWIEVEDRAGNHGYSSYLFTLDSTMPNVTYSGFAGDKTVDTTPELEFWVDDPHEGSARCGFDPADWSALADCTEGAGHTPASALTLGTHSFWIEASDSFGNSSSTVYTFEVVSPAQGTPGPTGGAGDPAATPALSLRAASSKVKKGKFTLTITVTATNFAACGDADIRIAPKVKKVKAVSLRSRAKVTGGACVATAKVKLPAKLKKKKATITGAQGGASKTLSIKL